MSAETNQVEKLCTGLNCGKPAKLQCPTCLKLKIEGSHFCSQDCFKSNWTTHKILHIKSSDGTYDPFPASVYSGKLRAQYPLSDNRMVPQDVEKPDHAVDGLPKMELKNRGSTKIEVLSEQEILAMREVCRLSREVLDIGASAVKAGVTTDYIDEVVHKACIERKCYPSPLNYHNFPKSCCTSVNEVICHGIPDKRPLLDGDIVNIDVSLYFNKHHGDLNQTYLVGNVDPAGKKLVTVTKQCLDLAIDACKPGFLYRDLGAIIESHAKANGFSVVRSYCGHGINRLFHTAPNVPHYTKNKAIGVMREGHCFTIEPMINEGSYHDIHWPDNWTATTKDGKRSAQFEHTLLVTKDGCEILTAAADERKDNSVKTVV